MNTAYRAPPRVVPPERTFVYRPLKSHGDFIVLALIVAVLGPTLLVLSSRETRSAFDDIRPVFLLLLLAGLPLLLLCKELRHVRMRFDWKNQTLHLVNKRFPLSSRRRTVSLDEVVGARMVARGEGSGRMLHYVELALADGAMLSLVDNGTSDSFIARDGTDAINALLEEGRPSLAQRNGAP